MAGYLARRVAQSVLVIWGALTIVFVVVRVIPGDPAALLLGPTATREQLARTRASFGLDRPLPEQYVSYLLDVARLDFGESVRLGGPAMSEVLQRLPATLSLAFAALALTVLVSFPLGVLAARRPHHVGGRLISVLSLAGQGMPQFWVGIMLILLFSATLRWLPASGFTSLQGLIMPAIALSLPFIGWLIRSVRSGVIDELGKDYVRTATAKGLLDGTIFYGHVLRNTLIPVTTVVGLLLGIFIGNAVIVEVVFAWPGVGRMLVDAIEYRDYSVVQAAVAVITVVYVVLNLAVDVLYTYLDPRVRFQEGG
ncbi:MAG: ABC transporter permease subunit [Streptosporangiales bacterium]|nr:ABC transporter permease subunit [Streptosporangiales bacterium]